MKLKDKHNQKNTAGELGKLKTLLKKNDRTGKETHDRSRTKYVKS